MFWEVITIIAGCIGFIYYTQESLRYKKHCMFRWYIFNFLLSITCGATAVLTFKGLING